MNNFSKIVVTVLLLVHCLQGQSFLTDKNVSIINSEEIINSGLFRNDNLFSLINNWDRISPDGYTWQISANALNSFQQQGWLLMLDGQRIDLNFMHYKNINYLPLVVNQIDSVEIINSPQIHSGEFSSEGLIHIHSVKPKSGFSLNVRVATGNPTGDPGPYVFTEYVSENVEEDGPEISLSMDYGSNSIFGRVLLFTETFAASDETIRERTPNIAYDSLKIRRFMPSLQLGTNLFNGVHNFFVGYSTSEQQPIYPESNKSNNLFYFPESVKDYSAHSIFKHIGLSGQLHFTVDNGLNYQLKASSNEISDPNGNDSNISDQKTTNYLFNSEFRLRTNRFGISYEHTKIKANYSSNETKIDLFKVYSELQWKFNGETDFGLNIFLVKAKSDLGLNSSLISIWKPMKGFSTVFNLGYMERIPDEDRRIWFYINKGYDLLSRLDIDYAIEGEIQKSKKLTADLNLNYKTQAKFEYSIGFIYRNFFNTSLEFVDADYIPEQSGFASFTTLNNNSSGQIAGTSFGIKNILSRTINHEIYYRFQTVLEGNNFFKYEWKTIPEHKLVYKFSFTPVQSFSIWAGLTFLSATKWEGFANLSDLSDGFYDEEIDSSFLLDVAFRKWFWQNYLRFALTFKNILNDEVRYHPVGPDFPLSIYFQAELAFESFYNI